MSVIRNAACVALAMLLLVAGSQVANAQGQGEFNSSTFTCLEYTNGLGAGASGRVQSQLGHLWMLGYMAGFYNASGNLELSGDAADNDRISNLMLQTCREFPQSSILVISMQALTTGNNKVPSTPTMDFTPEGYTCGQHVDARSGSASDANKADLADLWAFAFIQGYKNLASPDMEIDIENKASLIGAIDQNCAKNRDFGYLDLAAAVANAVKLE